MKAYHDEDDDNDDVARGKKIGFLLRLLRWKFEPNDRKILKMEKSRERKRERDSGKIWNVSKDMNDFEFQYKPKNAARIQCDRKSLSLFEWT